MKKIVAIVRPSKLETVKDALTAAGVKGMTISQVKGFGNQYGWKEYFRGNEILVNLLQKVKFEIITTDDRVDMLVDLIVKSAQTGEVGDGKIFISPIEEVVRIRTGERGEQAI